MKMALIKPNYKPYIVLRRHNFIYVYNIINAYNYNFLNSAFFYKKGYKIDWNIRVINLGQRYFTLTKFSFKDN